MDDELEKRLGNTELDATYVVDPVDPVDATPPAAKQSLFHRLFKREKKKKKKKEDGDEEEDDEPPAEKKPDGPKLKTFEIVSVPTNEARRHVRFVL